MKLPLRGGRALAGVAVPPHSAPAAVERHSGRQLVAAPLAVANQPVHPRVQGQCCCRGETWVFDHGRSSNLPFNTTAIIMLDMSICGGAACRIACRPKCRQVAGNRGRSTLKITSSQRRRRDGIGRAGCCGQALP